MCNAVLIESDWNLKLFPAHVKSFLPLVLIESDWNLKDHKGFCYIQKVPQVLIESDWNLKYQQKI